MVIPVSDTDDRLKAEQVMLEDTRKNAPKISEVSALAAKEFETDDYVEVGDFEPSVFYRIIDHWPELTVRFSVGDHNVREIKNFISRDMLEGFDAAGIGNASATSDIVGLPPVRAAEGCS